MLGVIHFRGRVSTFAVSTCVHMNGMVRGAVEEASAPLRQQKFASYTELATVLMSVEREGEEKEGMG
jgi:hypothetical protein